MRRTSVDMEVVVWERGDERSVFKGAERTAGYISMCDVCLGSGRPGEEVPKWASRKRARVAEEGVEEAECGSMCAEDGSVEGADRSLEREVRVEAAVADGVRGRAFYVNAGRWADRNMRDMMRTIGSMSLQWRFGDG